MTKEFKNLFLLLEITLWNGSKRLAHQNIYMQIDSFSK